MAGRFGAAMEGCGLAEPVTVLRCKTCEREFPKGTPVCPQHGDTLEEVDPLVGRVLTGKYKLQRCVGRGGMGSVYEARHIYTDQRVAVKVLAAHLSRDLKLVARFRREAMATSRLKHENCVGVHDFGEDEDGTFFIAMEFVDGRGIGDELRAVGPMEPGRVVRIGVQLLSALEAAHEAGILHRDLKPQNIMLTQKVGRPDFVKVVDFGIAKFIENSPEDQAALTLPGTIFGTPEYMSPEQARGETLDGRSDIYSAGVVLWHMLLGRSPYRGKTVRETLMKVFREPPPSASEERPDAGIPPELEKAMRKGLEKEAGDRYQSAADYRGAIEPFAKRLLSLSRGGGPISGRAADGAAPPETVGMDEQRERTGTQLSHVAATHVDGAATTAAGEPEPEPDSGDEMPTQAITDLPAETEATPAVDPDASTREGGPVPGTAHTPDAPPPATAPALESAGTVTTPAPDTRVEPTPQPEPAAPEPEKVVRPTVSVVDADAAMRRRKTPAAAWLAVFILGGAAIGVGLGVVAYRLSQREVVATNDPPARADAGVQAKADAGAPRREDPKVAAAGWIDVAKAAVAAEQPTAAILAYRKALEAEPDNVKAHHGLATVAMGQKDYLMAKEHLQRAMELDERYKKQLTPILTIVEMKLAKEGEGSEGG
jgi:serine/threonine-protein kinase